MHTDDTLLHAIKSCDNKDTLKQVSRDLVKLKYDGIEFKKCMEYLGVE